MAYGERKREQSVDHLWHPEREYDGNSTWIAKRDLRTVKDVTLEPHSVRFIDVGLPRSLARPFATLGTARNLISSRSMIAQLNAEVLAGSADSVAEAARSNDTQCEIGIQSHADHPITIQAGTGVGKLARWSSDTLQGSQLEQLVEKREIAIQGQEGRDWDYYIDEHSGMPVGLRLPLDPGYRRYLPKIDGEIVLTPMISGKEFRPQLDAWLQPVNGDKPPIEISQTLARLYLPPGIHGLIDNRFEHIPGNLLHINSPFIYGGETGIVGTDMPWPIRTEILRPTDGSPQPNYIVLTLSTATYDLAA